MEESSSKAKKEVKGKRKEKNQKKEKTNEKAKEKAKEKKSSLLKLNLTREKHAPYAKEHCSLKAGIIHQFPEDYIPTDAFAAVSILDGSVKLLFNEGKLYAQQNGIKRHTNKKK